MGNSLHFAYVYNCIPLLMFSHYLFVALTSYLSTIAMHNKLLKERTIQIVLLHGDECMHSKINIPVYNSITIEPYQ